MRFALIPLAAGVVVAAGCSATIRAPAPEPQRGPRENPSAAVHVLGVPPGQLPRPGQCRVWVPGVPPGRQARSRSCEGILATAPAGSMVLYRPSRERSMVRVRYIHEARVGVVITVRMFEAETGRFVRVEDVDVRDEEPEQRGRGRRP